MASQSHTNVAVGGLGACVSKADVLAETGEDLMYLSGSKTRSFLLHNVTDYDITLGERIVVLKHVQNDMYLVCYLLFPSVSP